MKTVKKIFCVFFSAIFLTLNCLAFSNKDLNLSFTTPNGYTELNQKNAKKNPELLELLGHSKESFAKYLEDNDICYFALTPKNKEQIIIKTFETDFSKELKDLSAGDENDETLVKAIVPKDASAYSVVTLQGTKYFQIIFKNTDSGGAFTAVQYLTVRNKKFYSICFNFSEKNLSRETLNNSFNMAKSLKIKNTLAAAVWSAQDILILMLIVLGIIGITVIIGLIIYSFVKDIMQKKKQIETGGDIKIERRRFK